VREDSLAGQLWSAVRSHTRVLLAVVPGLVASALHSTMLVVPRADFIDALDSDHYRIQWITGAYILGTAAGMALTQFAGSRLGLRYAYLLGVACFTLAGTACACVTEVIWMTPLRLGQGLGNGLVISVGMVLIWRAFPVHKGLAMALYGMAIYVFAVVGAPLGGLLTALESWRLIFALLLPVGCVAGLAAWRLLSPDRSQEGHTASFDPVGFVLLLSWITTMSVVLDMGQYWGWLASPNFVPWFAGLIVSFAGFVLWGLLAPRPLINLRVLAKPNFALGLGIKALFSVNLVVLLSMLANYMVNLRGYQWWQASLVIAPAVATMLTGLLAGVLWGTDRNRKLRMFAGLAVMAGGTAAFMMVDLYTAKGLQAACLALWGAGAGLVIGPALLTAFEGLSTEETLRAAGIFNIVRTLPAYIVGATLTILLTQSTDAQFDVLRQNIRTNRPIVAESFRRPERYFVDHGSPATQAGKQANAALTKWLHANSRAFALQGIVEYLSLAPALGLVLVLLVRVRERQQASPSG
jgi:MFS transporter, DHA2 family, multidrug resistance protein